VRSEYVKNGQKNERHKTKQKKPARIGKIQVLYLQVYFSRR
jgi:hypothetical protein